MNESVLIVEKEPDYWSGGHFYYGKKPWIDPAAILSLNIGDKLYTHPNDSIMKILRDLVPKLATVRMLNVEHVADEHNDAVEKLREIINGS